MVAMSRPRLAGSRGNCKAPPKAASIEPSANTLVNNQAWFTPSADNMSRSCVAARTSVPQRVRCNSSQTSASTSGPIRISNRS